MSRLDPMSNLKSFVYAIAALAVATFVAGEFTGRTLHRLNNQLAQLWVRLWVRQPAALSPAPPESSTLTMAVPVIHPLVELAAGMEALTTRQLQAITGCRRKARKTQLIALALALA